LSAEGQAEVVAALKRVQAQGMRTAKKTRTGFKGMNSVMGSTTKLLGGLGLALGVRQFTGFIRNAMNAGDQLNKLSRKIGATTEHLSALSLIARTADADLSIVGNGLGRMNRYIGSAMAGNIQAIATFRDLGVSIKDFDDKDAVEIFELLAQRITALPTAIQQGDVAMKIFGRGGKELLPTMQDLAEEGLGAVIERARELGVLIDTDLAAASERIKDDVEILKMQGEAMGVHFMAGFGPELSLTLQAITGDLGETTKAWNTFGQGLGVVLKFVVGAVAFAVDIITTGLGLIATSLVSVTRTGNRVLRGDFKGALEEIRTFGRSTTTELESIRDRFKGRGKAVFQFAAPVVSKDKKVEAQTGLSGEEMAELAAKRAQAMLTALERELSLVKASAKARTKAEQQEFDEGLQSVAQYYADRRAILDERLTEELAVLQTKRDEIAKLVDPAAKDREEAKLAQQDAEARTAHETGIADLLVEERQTVRDLAQERMGFEQELLRMQGDRITAERLGFQQQVDAYDRVLRQEGVLDEERQARVQRFRESLEAGADFEETRNAAQSAMDELGAARAEIHARMQSGLLSQFEGEQQLIELEMGRLVVLRQMAEAMEAAAAATGDPEKIAQAAAYTAAINEISYSVQASSDAFAQLETTAIDSATSALANFFETGLDGSKTLKEGMRDMAMAIISDLKKLVAQLLAAAIMKKVAGFFGAGGEVDPNFIGPMPAAAGGGQIRGPGTPTSDNLLIWTSPGEFVTRAAVAQQPEVLAHLQRLNKEGVRALYEMPTLAGSYGGRFAEGGLVANMQAAPDGDDSHLVVGLEDGLVLREMASTSGERVTMQTLRKHRREVGAILGGR
jgi:hypothetical protein